MKSLTPWLGRKMNEVKIRPVEERDMQEWLRMRMALWPGDHPSHYQEEMQELLANPPEFITFVAERSEGGLGAFLEASLRRYADGCDSSPVGYIEGWYVDPDLRRCGIGRRLVQAAEGWAASRGCQEMGSDTWIDNQVSLDAHLALGYREAERLIHFCKRLPARNDR
jgi:aminoglycoside 6'-N-acetyltransferase I